MLAKMIDRWYVKERNESEEMSEDGKGFCMGQEISRLVDRPSARKRRYNTTSQTVDIGCH